MASFVWLLQGTSPTTIDATDIIQFAGATFDSAITVGEYNDSTHVESSIGADDSSGNTPNNVKFISQTGGGAGDSQADWGDGTEDIDAILEAECTLKITFSHGSAVAVTANTFFAFDGTTPATAPTDIDVRAAELADIIFTQAEGSGSALSITDSGSATDHDFYILVSASPESVGEKTAFAFRMALTYT